jgi:serine/threonine protein kinase
MSKKKDMFNSILKAVNYLHEEFNYCHCDIRLSNVLINRGVYKLCDFECCEEGLESSIIMKKEYDYYSMGILFWRRNANCTRPRGTTLKVFCYK